MVELSDLNIALIIPEPSLNLWGVYIWKEGDLSWSPPLISVVAAYIYAYKS